MSQLTLYWNIGSQPARAIKTLIDIGKIPCNFVTIDMLRREQRDQPYLKMYSPGKVPIITDGDFVLGESGAIMIYLCEKYPIIAKYHG
jgi:glutathione S-transferase